jgi:hypothetical protein
MVDNVMAGYNSSIFAYGQTGAGKTYTMMGVVSPAGEPASEQVKLQVLMETKQPHLCLFCVSAACSLVYIHPMTQPTAACVCKQANQLFMK